MGASPESSLGNGRYTRTAGPVAQSVEQGAFNPKVAGSIPARPTAYVVAAGAKRWFKARAIPPSFDGAAPTPVGRGVIWITRWSAARRGLPPLCRSRRPAKASSAAVVDRPRLLPRLLVAGIALSQLQGLLQGMHVSGSPSVSIGGLNDVFDWGGNDETTSDALKVWHSYQEATPGLRHGRRARGRRVGPSGSTHSCSPRCISSCSSSSSGASEPSSRAGSTARFPMT